MQRSAWCQNTAMSVVWRRRSCAAENHTGRRVSDEGAGAGLPAGQLPPRPRNRFLPSLNFRLYLTYQVAEFRGFFKLQVC